MAAVTESCEWQEIATQENERPSLPRSGHCAAALPEDCEFDVIVFGGYTEHPDKKREASNDTLVFSAHTGNWKEVQPKDGVVPRVRLASQLAVVGNAAWLIGGWDPGHKGDGGDFLNDVWMLDLSAWRWTQVDVKGEQLEPISRFQAVAVGHEIYIHTHRSIHDILVLDTTTRTLHKRQVKGPEGTPSSRGLHSLTAVGSKLYLFGGAPKAGPMLGDLWCLTLADMSWQELHPAGDVVPHVRCSHAVAAMGDKVYFAGGAFYRDDAPGLQGLDDFFYLDTTASRWVFPTVGGAAPSPRNAATLCAIPGNKLLLYGGWRAFVESYNDTFVMQL